MTDPITAAATAAGKTIATAVAKRALLPGTRLGSPQERRVVYAQFTAVVTRWLMLNQRLAALRRQPWWVFTPIQWARLPLELNVLESELLIGYQETHLVASAPVLAAADEVLTLCGESPNLANDRRVSGPQFSEHGEQLAAALRRFTLVSRADLAYVPRRWEIWRPGWRQAHRERKASQQAITTGSGHPELGSRDEGRGGSAS